MLCRVALGTQIVEQRIIIQREALQKLEISIQIIFKAVYQSNTNSLFRWHLKIYHLICNSPPSFIYVSLKKKIVCTLVTCTS